MTVAEPSADTVTASGTASLQLGKRGFQSPAVI